jgi:thiamine pyridinylase
MLKNKKKITSQFLLIVFSLLVLLSPDEIFARKPPQKQTLRVALFPYIPDSAKDNYKALLKRIETEFEKKNHLIDLQLRPLNANDDFYGTDQLKTWLSSASGDDAYDIVEVDALLLDDLVKNDVISNWKTQLNIKDWHPAGYRASVINNQIYGVPHWLCGHFIISHDQSISEAKSLSDLINLLSKANTNIPNLTADLLGSWNLPSIYLDVWADTYGASNVAKGLNVNLDKEVLNQLKSFSNQCMTEGTCFTVC